MRSQGGAASGGVPWIGHQNEEKVKEEILGLSSVIFFFQNASSSISPSNLYSPRIQQRQTYKLNVNLFH